MVVGEKSCRGLNSYQLFCSHIPHIVVVSHTSTLPQNDVGSYVGLHMKYTVRQTAPAMVQDCLMRMWVGVGGVS